MWCFYLPHLLSSIYNAFIHQNICCMGNEILEFIHPDLIFVYMHQAIWSIDGVKIGIPNSNMLELWISVMFCLLKLLILADNIMQLLYTQYWLPHLRNDFSYGYGPNMNYLTDNSKGKGGHGICCKISFQHFQIYPNLCHGENIH